MASGTKLESQGNTPLHEACSKVDYNRVLMLLLQGTSTSALNIWRQTPLHISAMAGDVHVMLLLLDSGADVNVKDSDFVSPLYQAVVYGRLQCVELLLCYGASPYNPEGTAGHLSPLELSESVPKCHAILEKARDSESPVDVQLNIVSDHSVCNVSIVCLFTLLCQLCGRKTMPNREK